MNRSKSLDQLIELVRSAKSLALDRDSIAQRSEKGAFDYATQADIRVQAYLEQELRRHWPSHRFIGEESPDSVIDPAAPAFVVDPIDGTTNLIHFYPQCAISVAMVEKRQAITGVVYNPFTNQTFYAQRGQGAYCDGEKIHVSHVSSLDESLISIGTSPNDKKSVQEDFSIIGDLFMGIQDIRRGGAAALEIVYVACGITEAFFERCLKPWDFAAAQLILEEAGGCVSDFSNKALCPFDRGSCLATNRQLHEILLPYMRRLARLRAPA